MRDYVKILDNNLYWAGDVHSDLALEFIPELKSLDQSFENIIIHCLSSEGGCASSCSAIMDAVLSCKAVITTIGYGLNASSAALIFLCGDHRILYERACLMIHEGSISLESTLSSVKRESEVAEIGKQMDIQFLTNRSSRPPSYWQEEFEKGDIYIFPTEALELDLINEIYSF